MNVKPKWFDAERDILFFHGIAVGKYLLLINIIKIDYQVIAIVFDKKNKYKINYDCVKRVFED